MFKKQYPNSTIKTINAGIGGTGSSLGVSRVQYDVLLQHPDLIFVEFAVNDMETDSLTVCNSMEGIVRQIIESNPYTDICFLYTINEDMIDTLQHQQLWSSMRYMERIADYYKLPSIYFGKDVLQLLDENKLVFKSSPDSNVNGKIIFTNDGTHPTTEGHKIYTAAIEKSFDAMKSNAKIMMHKLPSPLYVNNYEKGKIFLLQAFKMYGSWKNVQSDSDRKIFLNLFPEMLKWSPNILVDFPSLIYSDNPNDSIAINFKGTMFGFGDIIGQSSIGFKISVDGGKEQVVQRFDNYSTYFRRNYYLYDALPNAIHHIVINQIIQKLIS